MQMDGNLISKKLREITMTYFHLDSAGCRSNGNSEILAKIDVRASSLIDVLANLTSDQLWWCVVIHCTGDGG